MMRPRLVVAVAFVVVLGACKGSSKALPATLPPATLPADDLEAGRALGKAAATEKDPTRLAALLVAFLDRLHVAVVSQKGDGLLAKGPLSPAVHAPWLWEPVVVGVARATTLGDQRPIAQVLNGFGHTLDGKALAKVDFGGLFADIAAAAAKHPLPVFGPIAAALAEDLKERGELRAHPRLDPTATLLVGLMLAAEQVAERASPPDPVPPPSASGRPGLPYPFPRLPVVPPRTVHAFGFTGSAGAVATACKWAAAEANASSAAFGGVNSALSKAQGWLGATPPPEIAGFMSAIAPALEGASLASEVTEGIAGMGIAAFTDVDGKVDPTKVKYGDGPATYTVTVKSVSPFTKDELDQFVNCLEAQAPGIATGTIENLRSIPPAGGMANVPVLWVGTGQYDPKHGTFSPMNASVPDGILPPLVKAGVSAAGGGTTDQSGQTKATFQVKPKKSDTPGKRYERYTIDAEVFPFPVGTSIIYGASNALFSREIPIALEIEVPFDEWILDLDWTVNVEPMGGWVRFQDVGHAQVKFKLDPHDLTFHATASGTHTYSLPPQSAPGPGGVTCAAPVGPQPVNVALDGKVTSFETMLAEMHLKVTTLASTEAMTVTCKSALAPKAASRAANARVGSISEGTKLEDFTMTLDDGEAVDVPIDKMGGPMHIAGPAHVKVSVDGG